MLLRAQGFSEAPPARVLGLDPPPPGILSWLISWNFLSFGLCLGSAANNPVSHGQPSWALAPVGSTERVGPMPQQSAPQHPPSAALPSLDDYKAGKAGKEGIRSLPWKYHLPTVPPGVRAAVAAVQGLLGRSSLGLWGMSPKK